MQSRALTLFVVVALVGLALVAAHGHHERRHGGGDGEGRHDGGRHGDRHGDRHHDKPKGCSDPVGDFYRRHVQCRQCIMGSEGDTKTHKWCAAVGATSDKQGQCVEAHVACPVTGNSHAITAVASCPTDAPASKHSCSLCTLDGYAWCQDELASDDEYSGECVALSKPKRASAADGAAIRRSDDSDASGDASEASGSERPVPDILPFLAQPRVQSEDNLSDFSDFRGDEEESSMGPRDGDEGSGDDSNASEASEASDANGAGASDASEASEASDASSKEISDSSAFIVARTAKCPAGKRVVTKFATCSSAVAQASSSRRHGGRWMRRVAFAVVPLAIVLVVALIVRKRCKRRCQERRAARLARQNGLAVLPAGPAGTVAAMPPHQPQPMVALATAVPVAAYPMMQPVRAQPLLYSHNMGASAPAMYQPVEGVPAAVEMHAIVPDSSMYPGLAAGGRGYARLGQDVV